MVFVLGHHWENSVQHPANSGSIAMLLSFVILERRKVRLVILMQNQMILVVSTDSAISPPRNASGISLELLDRIVILAILVIANLVTTATTKENVLAVRNLLNLA
jgi:hypothetical protein